MEGLVYVITNSQGKMIYNYGPNRIHPSAALTRRCGCGVPGSDNDPGTQSAGSGRAAYPIWRVRECPGSLTRACCER